MKKLITLSSIVILALVIWAFNAEVTVQQNIVNKNGDDDPNYAANKRSFWTQYQNYKNIISDGRTAAIPPVDPTGTFRVDEFGNFVAVVKDKNPVFTAPNPFPPQPDVVSGYTWSQPVTTYTNIVGTLITSGAQDDGSTANLPIGFTFTFDGTAYTAFGCGWNGEIIMGTALPNAFNYVGLNSTDNNMISAGEDLQGYATGRIEYLTTGVAPNRVLTVQWSNWGFYNGTANGTYTFQFKLFETSNNIQIVYGTNTFGTVAQTPSVGLRGASAADFNDRTTTTNWSATTAGPFISSTCSFASGVVPALNLTYQWVPPVASSYAYSSSTTAQIQNGLNIAQSSTNNQIIQVSVVITGTLPPVINMTDMTFNTAGSTNAATDILNAKVYSTGTSNVFATTTQFGSTFASPNGAFTVSGSVPLLTGTNYFWLTYDATAGATPGDLVDAQCTQIIGSGTMGVRTPTVTSPVGWKQIDNYCRPTVSFAGCPFNIYTSNVTFNTLNQSSGCDPNLNFPYVYNWYLAPITNVEQGVTYPIFCSIPAFINSTAWAIWIDWNNNNLLETTEYYFIPALVSPAVTGTTNIPVPVAATLGNHRMRIRADFAAPPTSGTSCSNLTYGECEDYTINVVPSTPMVYVSSTTTQITGNFYAPQTNLGIIGVQIVTTGSLSPLSATSFTFNTNGSTNPPTDITNAKVWSTGTSNVFATTTQFGSTFSGPSGSFTVGGSQVLANGTSYFWVTYDIPSTATALNFVDAECNSLTVGSAFTPTVQAPAGNRQILGSALCGTSYTIPGSYASIAAAVADLNLRGVSCAVTFNISSGYTETMPAGGYVINAAGSSATNTITFQRVGATNGATGGDLLPNPLISTTVAGLGTVTISSFGSNGDAFFKLNGTDYVTFDGIDMIDLYTGALTGPKMEYGFMLLKPTATDGCKNITIKNCNITFALTNTTAVSAGIYTSNYTTAGGITTTTSIAGRHENIFIDGNNIYNTITGMYFDGTFDGVSPYNLYNNNIQVGVTTPNTMICGSRTTTNAVVQYGIYAIYNDSMKLNNNIIRCNTGNNTPTTYGIFTSTGTNSSIDIIGNNVSDSLMYTTFSTSTQQAGIYNTFGQSPTTASNVVNINNNNIHDCAYPTAAGPNIFYIANIAGAHTVNINGNTVTNNYQGGGASGTATGTQYGIYNSATVNLTAGSTYNVANNNVNNIIRTQSAAGLGTTYGVYVAAGSLITNINNNNVNTITLNTTTGNFGGIYMPTTISGGTLNIFSNTVNAITRSANVTSGISYMIYASQGTATSNIYSNTVSNFNQPVATSTGIVYGFYDFGISPVAVNFYNNTFSNILNGGTGTTYGVYQQNGSGTSPLNKQVYGNNINNITSGTGTAGGQAIGLTMAYGTTINAYKNRIYNVTSFNSTGLSPASIGMQLTTSGTTFNVYNNLVHEIKAPAANLAPPNPSVIGIQHNIAATNMYFNTVYLDAASTGVNFGTAALWSNTIYTLDLRNNILINKSTPMGTGIVTAYQRSTTTLGTYAATSDRNNFYGGAPAANKLIFYDGTSGDQTITAYKTRVGLTRDANSVTENTTFVNTSSSPYDLHLALCTFSQCESNASVVSSPISIVDDYDGNARYPNAGYPTCSTWVPTMPDMGADEWGGQFVDAVPPIISYTLLGNGVVAGTRAFSNVTITDASGINTTPGTRPRCYYKKTTDANAYVGNTSADNGWKWVESNGTTTPFDFTINYGILQAAVVATDMIQYFVVAQDLVATPNVGINSGTFFGAPANVADYANIFPLGGTINQYTIVASTYSGGYNVGSCLAPYPDLTGPTGLFQAINAGVVSGNITANICSDITEPGTNPLNQWAEDGVGGYTLTIRPLDATLKTISGSVAGSLITLNGSDRVIIDGNAGLDATGSKYVNAGLDLLSGNKYNNGRLNATGTKYLLFRNTNGANPTISFINDARKNTIKNCTIESNNATTNLGTLPGTIFFGTTTGVGGNDSNTITENDIRDRSDVAPFTGVPAYGIFSLGNIGSTTLYNDNIIVSLNNIYNYGIDASSFFAGAGVMLENGNHTWTITGNSFYQTGTRTITLGATHAGVQTDINSQYGITVTDNFFGGSAPLAVGTLTYTGAGTFTVEGFDLNVGGQGVGQTASSIQNNTIQNINLTTSPAAGSSNFFRGIRAVSTTGLVNIGNVTGNTIGNTTTTGNITLTTNTTVTLYTILAIEHTGFGSVSNNTIGSITLGGTSTLVNWRCIQWTVGLAGATTITITNNMCGSNTTPNSIQNVADAVRGTSSRGISTTVNSPATLICTGNTIANWNFPLSSSTASSTVNGIQNLGTGNHTISNNIIHDLSLATGYALFTNMLCGLQPSQTVGAAVLTCTQNTVYNLFMTNTGAFSSIMEGILVTGGNPGSVVSRNKIYNLTSQQTGSPVLAGIGFFQAVNVFADVTNNMISLTNGEPTDIFYAKLPNAGVDITSTPLTNISRDYTPAQEFGTSLTKQKYQSNAETVVDYTNSAKDIPVEIVSGKKQNEKDLFTNGLVLEGFELWNAGNLNFYYNSVYVGGNATAGALNSACFRRYNGAGTVNLKNNLFVNARTGGAGKNYVINNELGATGWSSSNYNVFLGSSATTIGQWTVGVDRTINEWRTSSGTDNQTWSTQPGVVSPTNLFTSISTGNLLIQSGNVEAWLVSGKGIAIAGQNIDYEGTPRVTTISGGCTDIGADEFVATPPSNPAATVDNAPGSGVTSTYTLWSRVITIINWGLGGTSYPSSLSVNYYSGVNPSPVSGGFYSNSHTLVTPTGSLAGATYDYTQYLGDNETFTITSPNANTRLAKYDGTWEVFSVAGTGVYQTELVWNGGTSTYWAKTRGLSTFSDFALTDATSALPVTLREFKATIDARDVNLRWITTTEINNSGFWVQRRAHSENKIQNEWTNLNSNIIPGNGTTNEEHTYNYSDKKVPSGKYEYRLKQLDYNGHAEFYVLNDPSIVEVGKPIVFDMSQNYPNPSNPKSKIDYQLPFDGKVDIRIYDVLGREVIKLVDIKQQLAGYYTTEFDGSNLASGIYFYRIVSEGGNQKFTKTLKLVLVK